MSIQIRSWSSVSESPQGGSSNLPAWNVGESNCHGMNSGQTLVGVVSALDPRWTSEQWVRASGLVPSLPGQKQIQRLNWERYSDQCACQHVSFFMEVKYSRFLWSVTISIRFPEPRVLHFHEETHML